MHLRRQNKLYLLRYELDVADFPQQTTLRFEKIQNSNNCHMISRMRL